MSTSTERNIPSLEIFLEDNLETISPPEDECSICLLPYANDDAVVSAMPCKHSFHRECLIHWFKAQLLHPDGSRNQDCQYGSCPLDRTKLFHATDMEAPYICARTGAQLIHGLKGTQFEAIGREALERLRSSSAFILDLVEDIVNRMVQQNPEYEPIATQLGVMHLQPTPLPRPQVRLITQQYQVDVDTEEQHSFVNEAIRADTSSLTIMGAQHLDADIPVSRQGIDFVSLIEPILQGWEASGYPRTNYITSLALHRLVICAMLVRRVSSVHGHANTAAYAQLLAHGEGLLLDAQQRVASGLLNEVELREHHRVLDWQPSSDSDNTFVNSQSNLTVYSHNTPRVQWIVWLRQHTHRAGADPLGP